jgi:pyruvate kinase
MRRQRRTKIVATLGPASSDQAMIDRLFIAGADVFRINMSHTPHDAMRGYVKMIRAVEEQHGRPIGILVDLQGPKLRLDTFEGGGAQIAIGASFVLDSEKKPGDAERAHLPHPEVLASLEVGHRLLDRRRQGAVARDRGNAEARRHQSRSRRTGVGPQGREPARLHRAARGALTPKDRSDLEAALEAGIDWIGLSFIQRPEDVAEAKKLTRGRAAVLAKIEKPQAVARLAEIMEQADSLMVARGDLGVEMPLESVPGLQKQITHAARHTGRPVVIATQMLESMITAPVPTRAEVSDVATAIYDGADAVMLSAESAAGKYPVEAVETMNRIAEAVENDPAYRSAIMTRREAPEATGADAIAAAARQIAETLKLAAILCLTSSGATALRVARERPEPPVIALSPNLATARRLAIVWGVHCVVTDEAHDIDAMVARACRIAFRENFARTGQRVIVVAGVPLGTPGATNMVRIAFVGADDAGVD